MGELGKTYSDYNILCQDNDIVQAVLKSISIHGIKSNLEKFEIPRMVTLVPEAWTPESGLVTAAFKIKRKVIQTFFQQDIDQMYKGMIWYYCSNSEGIGSQIKFSYYS